MRSATGGLNGPDPWLELETGPEGSQAADGCPAAEPASTAFSRPTPFEPDFSEPSPAWLGGPGAGTEVSFAAARMARVDRLADAMEEHLDLAAIEALIASPARKQPRLVWG